MDGTDTGDECLFFMINVFDESNLKNKQGIFHNHSVFDVNESDVDEFDRQFEFKEKLVLEGQLKEL